MNKPIYIVPISCKGIVIEGGSVWLRKNERNEWEIPGGKEDVGEQPEETVVRELNEELGVKVSVEKIIHAYMHSVKTSLDEIKGVLVLIYKCKFEKRIGVAEESGEAGTAQFKQFLISEALLLNMPEFYKDALRKIASADAVSASQ